MVDSTETDLSPASSDQEAKRKKAVASVAWWVPRLPAGDRAALRRAMLTDASKVDMALIGLLHRAEVPEIDRLGPAGLARWRLLAHFAAVLWGTAAVSSPNDSPHDPKRGLGHALQEAGYSSLRLMRLTSARGPVLSDQVMRAARYLAQANERAVDLWAVRHLVSGDADRVEEARLRIARDYFQSEHAKKGTGS